MSKLKLVDIRKSYKTGNTSIEVLKGISLEFRDNEFVSILGQSGCGKTTLLNTIGGLDHYDSGDLLINNLSTKKFKDSDWDAYRNRSIGFVFQNYNLISHQTVLQNVEISMTLSGVSPSERRKRAIEALSSVGLANQLNKRPAQMSGGQMQRVAIARALVNNPDIILADEPTGALDSHTSVQVMEILKEISKTRLVIMVTHNGELAEKYSNRIIRLLDGEVQSDSNPISKGTQFGTGENAADTSIKDAKPKKTSMSLKTAISLSFRNLLTKKGRTAITSFAGSIGIIGVALVLALSNGLSSYINTMQSKALSGFPIAVNTTAQKIQMRNTRQDKSDEEYKKFPSGNVVYSYDKDQNTTQHTNVLTEDYLNYIGKLETSLPGAVNNISYTRSVNFNVLAKGQDSVIKYETSNKSAGMASVQAAMGMSNLYWQEMPDNTKFILSLYDLIGEGSRMPTSKNEVVLVVDEYNRLDKAFLEKLGLNSSENYKLTDLIGKTILKVIPNDNFYTKQGNIYVAANPADYKTLYEANQGVPLTITGILRIKEDAATSYLNEGIAYTTALTDYVVADAQKSQVALAQNNSDKDVLSGAPFANDTAKKQRLLSLGADTTPTGINIYPKNFESKDKIKNYLDAYNKGKSDTDKITYTDLAEQITSMTGTLINTVTYVLVGFAAISLIVSTIMISIITYVSVIERTKEIGILRSVGARKKDISRVFNAETLIIGFAAGILGVGLSYLISIPINVFINKLVNIQGLASLKPLHAILLILGSMALTLIAGLIPAHMAAKKDPVEALRTE